MTTAVEDILAWCDKQDALSKGESMTTAAIRKIIRENEMGQKVVKYTKLVGQGNAQGVSFPEGAFMYNAREGYMDIQEKAKRMGAVTTGPARILVVVEQDVITND